MSLEYGVDAAGRGGPGGVTVRCGAKRGGDPAARLSFNGLIFNRQRVRRGCDENVTRTAEGTADEEVSRAPSRTVGSPIGLPVVTSADDRSSASLVAREMFVREVSRSTTVYRLFITGKRRCLII